jgi:hypothetical protein
LPHETQRCRAIYIVEFGKRGRASKFTRPIAQREIYVGWIARAQGQPQAYVLAGRGAIVLEQSPGPIDIALKGADQSCKAGKRLGAAAQCSCVSDERLRLREGASQAQKKGGGDHRIQV